MILKILDKDGMVARCCNIDYFDVTTSNSTFCFKQLGDEEWQRGKYKRYSLYTAGPTPIIEITPETTK